MKIGFLGYGEAAQAFHEGLRRPGLDVLAYDVLLDRDDPAIREAMIARGAKPVALPELAAADWIFSAVTADQSFLAVEPMLAHLRQGQVLFDINSVSPDRKRETAFVVTGAGAEYLDMAVMAPVHPKKHATPVLIAGGPAERLLPQLKALGFECGIVAGEAGAATAIKMVRSLFVKGLEAITVETLLAARASGCFDHILQSLATSYPGLDFPNLARYQFERTTRHGKRRAAEMRESAATLDALGLHGALASEIADVQDRMGSCGTESGEALGETVARVLSARIEKNR